MPNAKNISHQEVLDDLKVRITDARGARQKTTAQKGEGNMMGLAYRVIAEMLAGIGVGGFIGWWIDNIANTRPIFLVIMLMLGMAAGVLTSYRTLIRASESENKTEQD